MKKAILLASFLIGTFAFAQTNAAKEGTKQFDAINSQAKTDGTDMAVYNLIEAMYNELLLPDMGVLSETTIANFQGIMMNDGPNKNILDMLIAYQEHVSGVNDIVPDTGYQLMATETMIKECQKIYNKLPALLLIYRGEALVAAEKAEEAMAVFQDLLRERPDCIPAKVYIYQLTPEGQEKTKMAEVLKKEKPNHWMVKEMIE